MAAPLPSRHPGDVQAEKIDFVAAFFGKLGDMLGSVADQKLSQVSEAPFRL